MRILDGENDQKLNRVILYLTLSEAQEFLDSLKSILQKPKGNHAHIPSKEFDKEITICIYDESNLDGFNERSKKLILNDE